MKLIRDDWAIMLYKRISTEWEWSLVPMGIGTDRKTIEGSTAYKTKEEALEAAKTLARNLDLKLYSPNTEEPGTTSAKSAIQNALSQSAGAGATPLSGSAMFSELCLKLIDDEGYHYLCPEIGRTRSTDWTAFIFAHHDKDRKAKLAEGQADTLDEACEACVADFHERQRIKARKEELLKEPIVREALELFKQNAQDHP